MSDLLVENVVNKFLNLSTSEKEEVGSRITEALGGDSTKEVTGLPPRRGNQDGGLDGRIPVYRKIVKTESMFTKSGREEVVRREEPRESKVEAGVTVKLEDKEFSRERLGGFKMDLEREELRDGVIITARGLSQDAVVLVERLNEETEFRFMAPTLGDFLSQRVPESPIKFVYDPNEAIQSALETISA